jgi:hypothetical protein
VNRPVLHAAIAFITATCSLLAQPRVRAPSHCGDRVVGLSLCLSSTADPEVLSLEVRNDTGVGALVDIGVMLANGTGQYPRNLTLLLRDSSGRESEGSSLDPGGVAGRLDPLVLALPPGASTRLPLRVSRYLFRGIGTSNVTSFAPGQRYAVRVKLTARQPSASELNLDVKGLASLAYWTGSAISNPILVAWPATAR